MDIGNLGATRSAPFQHLCEIWFRQVAAPHREVEGIMGRGHNARTPIISDQAWARHGDMAALNESPGGDAIWDHPLDKVFPAQPSVVVREPLRYHNLQVREARTRYAGARRNPVEDISGVEVDHERPACALRGSVKCHRAVNVLG